MMFAVRIETDILFYKHLIVLVLIVAGLSAIVGYLVHRKYKQKRRKDFSSVLTRNTVDLHQPANQSSDVGFTKKEWSCKNYFKQFIIVWTVFLKLSCGALEMQDCNSCTFWSFKFVKRKSIFALVERAITRAMQCLIFLYAKDWIKGDVRVLD